MIAPAGHVTSAYIIGPEALLGVGVLEEVSDGQDVGARVHHHEEKDTTGEDARQLWVVLGEGGRERLNTPC